MVTCQEQHSKCNADCCRMFTIPVTNKERVVLHKQSADLKKYYRLHGARIVHDKVIIRLNDYRVETKNDKLLLWRDCDWLDNKTLLCKHHDTKPLVCSDLDHDTVSKYYVTPNCRFNTQK